jgi:uncharacterized protein
VRLVNRTRGAVLADHVEVARSFGARLKGLLGRDGLPPGTALAIEPCTSVHTLFMRFVIDAAFVDAAGHVVAAVSHLRPWRATRVYLSAHRVIELPAGTLDGSGTRVGDLLALED